jgi:hypothetical protein
VFCAAAHSKTPKPKNRLINVILYECDQGRGRDVLPHAESMLALLLRYRFGMGPKPNKTETQGQFVVVRDTVNEFCAATAPLRVQMRATHTKTLRGYLAGLAAQLR